MAHDLYEVVDGELRVYPHYGQWRALTSERRWVVVTAGTQSGKTSFAPLWLHSEIASSRGGPGDYLFAAPTFRLLEVKALPEMRRFFEDTLRLGRFYRSPVPRFVFSTEGARRTFGDHWSVSSPPTQVFFGHAANPESLESATYRAAVLDEAGQDQFKQGSWEAIQRRLSLARGRAFIGTTIYNLGWVKTKLIDAFARGDQDVDIIQFDSTANPKFSVEEFERARRVLPKWRFDMQYRGIPSRPAGLIYSNFDTAKHVIPRFEIPSDWRRVVGLDFGQVNTAAVFLAERPGTRELYLYKEYGPVGGRTGKQHYAAMMTGEPIDPHTRKRIRIRAVGGAPSEDDWRDEFTGAGLYVERPPISEVEVGIDRVYGAIARDELRVFSDCEKTLAQIADYSREVDEDHDYEVTDEISEKHRYHLCFVADTMVTTDQGDVPIQDVRPGMLALTRSDYRRVVDAAQTGAGRRVLEATFSDGTTLTGTPDHPIWVQDKGWIPLDSLRYDDYIIRVEDAQCERRFKSSTGSGITDIPTLRARLTVAISSARAPRSTARCGSSTAVRSRPGSMSTTSTTTPATTSCPTSSWYRAAITSTRDILTSRHSASPSSRSSFGQRRLAGISLRRGGPGTPSTLDVSRQNANHPKESVSDAAPATRRGSSVAQSGSARTLAERLHVVLRALTTWSERARGAGKPTRSTATSRLGSAPVRVLGVREAGSADVFNLTVDDQHEYFANGVLVSNCDALRYAISPLRDSPIPTSTAARPISHREQPSARRSRQGPPKAPVSMWDVIADPSKLQPRRH